MVVAPQSRTHPPKPHQNLGTRNPERLATGATAVVLACGIALRLWRPDLAQVNFDESNVASLVAAWKYQGAFPLVGTVSSYDFRAGHGWPWFAALGLLPSDDPYALVAIGLTAGIAGLVACWWVARRWLGPWGGVAAAAFHGTAFYCVLLERGVWQPVFLQAPMALCLDALLRLGVQRRPWALAVACGWLGVLISVHYTAIAFVLVVPLAAWYARRALRPEHIAVAVVVGLLPLMPFLLYESNPSVRFQELRELLSLSRGTSSFDFDTVSSTIQISTTLGADGLGGHASGEIAAALGRWTEISLLGPVLAAVGLVVGVIRRPGAPTGYLIAAWTLAPIVAYLRHSAPVIFHYMFLEFPGLAFCVGALGAWATSGRSRLIRSGVALSITACASASALSAIVLLGALDHFDLSAGYGVPIGYSRTAGDAARNAMPADGMVLIGDDPHAGEVLRFTVGFGTPSRTFEDCREVPYAPEAVYLLASEQTPGAGALEAARAPLLKRIPRPGGDAYRLYGAPAAEPASGVIPVTEDPANRVCADRIVWDSSA